MTPNGADVVAARAMMGDGCIDLDHLGRLVRDAGYAGFAEVEVSNAQLWKRDKESVLGDVVERFERHIAGTLARHG